MTVFMTSPRMTMNTWTTCSGFISCHPLGKFSTPLSPLLLLLFCTVVPAWWGFNEHSQFDIDTDLPRRIELANKLFSINRRRSSKGLEASQPLVWKPPLLEKIFSSINHGWVQNEIDYAKEANMHWLRINRKWINSCLLTPSNRFNCRS